MKYNAKSLIVLFTLITCFLFIGYERFHWFIRMKQAESRGYAQAIEDTTEQTVIENVVRTYTLLARYNVRSSPRFEEYARTKLEQDLVLLFYIKQNHSRPEEKLEGDNWKVTIGSSQYRADFHAGYVMNTLNIKNPDSISITENMKFQAKLIYSQVDDNFSFKTIEKPLKEFLIDSWHHGQSQKYMFALANTLEEKYSASAIAQKAKSTVYLMKRGLIEKEVGYHWIEKIKNLPKKYDDDKKELIDYFQNILDNQ